VRKLVDALPPYVLLVEAGREGVGIRVSGLAVPEWRPEGSFRHGVGATGGVDQAFSARIISGMPMMVMARLRL